MSHDAEDLAARFWGTAPQRTIYCPEYDSRAVDYLRERFVLAGAGRLLDLGRGSGRIGVGGYLLSLSFCSPAVLGEEREAFERAVREQLAAFGEPPSEEAATVCYIREE
jgi:hypothetical protein